MNRFVGNPIQIACVPETKLGTRRWAIRMFFVLLLRSRSFAATFDVELLHGPLPQDTRSFLFHGHRVASQWTIWRGSPNSAQAGPRATPRRYLRGAFGPSAILLTL